MPALTSLTQAVLEQAFEQTRDHQELLTNMTVRIEPFTSELTKTWSQLYCDQALSHPIPPEPILHAVQEEGVRVLFGGLRKGDLRQYFVDVNEWALQTAHSGMTFDQVVLLIREYICSGLPYLRQFYAPGPELENILGALDDLYSATITLIGAAYIETLQVQMARGMNLRILGELTVGAAHALNNLFSGILGKAQLELELLPDPEHRREFEEIRRMASGGAQIVRRLQDYGDTSSEDKFAAIDLNSIVRNAAEITRFLWRDRAEANNLTIDVVKDIADIPPALGRANDLRQVIVSLILNGIEAMPQGGMITLKTERRGDQVLLAVTDTGEGMNEETKLQLFSRFFTTKAPPHAGLGLALAADIVKEHNGVFTVESTPGRGATFTMALPVAPEEAHVNSEPRSRSEHPVRVLIVDDEPTVRDVVAKFLGFRGLDVKVADSGRSGIQAFRDSPFDLVLTDLGMPGLSGWDVAREVKRQNPRTLVVLMSGWASELDNRKLKDAGVDRLVHKPFDVDQVLDLVNEAQSLRSTM